VLDVAGLEGFAPGEPVDVAIRPENIRIRPDAAQPPGKIVNHVFLGNLSEYVVALPSGPMLRVQTHPRQRFAIGDTVAVEIDAAQCSVFRRDSGQSSAGKSGVQE
jgi:ABC-type Fe3+/spermidine/putrescine transport system ATPase subunit